MEPNTDYEHLNKPVFLERGKEIYTQLVKKLSSVLLAGTLKTIIFTIRLLSSLTMHMCIHFKGVELN